MAFRDTFQVSLFDRDNPNAPPEWEGDFASLDFPSNEAREEARERLWKDGRFWLDATTLAVRS